MLQTLFTAICRSASFERGRWQVAPGVSENRPTASYNFLTVWLLDAPIAKVWDAIRDYEHLPTWWQSVAQMRQVQPGKPDGVDSVWLMTWKTPLAYTLTFESRIIRVEAPTLLALTASGEAEGTGRWELSTMEAGTLVRYYWSVRTTKAWMNLLAVFIRPLMEWNHNAIMHQGAEGLATFLGARLLKEESLRLAQAERTQNA